ncbi:MAG: gliding motility lipoprotein GldH, partial [Capnocytophaga granulosa]
MNRIFLFSIGFLLLASCGENIQYSEYETLPQGWPANKAIAFRYQATDTLQKHNLFIMLRNNNDYPYSNIFLITKMEFPNNQVVVDTLEYEMATTEGKWLGEGASIK